MGLNAGTKIMIALSLLGLLGCSGDAPPAPKRYGPSPVSAAGSGSTAPAGGVAGSGTAGPTAPIDADNPNMLLPLPPPPVMMATGGMGGGAPMGPAAGDGCEDGKFCAPTGPDPTDCGKLNLKTNVKMIKKPGNVLVVFDRSTSMEADWGGMPKYQAAGNALLAAIMPVKDLLTVGGVFFPSTSAMADPNCPMGCNIVDPIHWIPGPGACCLNITAGSCTVTAITEPDQIQFTPADTFIQGMPMQWHLAGAAGTPLQEALIRANEAITAKMWDDPLIVIVMTDGEPNCMLDPNTVLAQIGKWKDAGIATHVVGLPGAQAAAQTLNSIAQAGGTMTYIDPADPMALQQRLETVISTTVKTGFDTCSFDLDPAAEVPEKLHLIVTQKGMEADVARNLSADAHWSINAEGTKVELEGQLCDMAKDGTFEAIRFVFGCVDTPPLPPPPPPPMLN